MNTSYNSSTKKPLTPMMQQYWQLKKQHEDKYLFFRLGDFYELFENDAINGAKIMAITLTHRHGIPMCGVPHHQLLHYAKRLLTSGHKIAIVEQTETPSTNVKLLRRQITEILTPSSLTHISTLNEESNNFLLTVEILVDDDSLLKGNSPFEKKVADDYAYLNTCLLDISTGESILQKMPLRLPNSNALSDNYTFYFTLSSLLANVVSQASPSEILMVCKHLNKQPSNNSFNTKHQNYNPQAEDSRSANEQQLFRNKTSTSEINPTNNKTNPNANRNNTVDFFPLQLLNYKTILNDNPKNNDTSINVDEELNIKKKHNSQPTIHKQTTNSSISKALILEATLAKIVTQHYQNKLPTGVISENLFDDTIPSLERFSSFTHCFGNETNKANSSSSTFNKTLNQLTNEQLHTTFFSALSYMQYNTGRNITNCQLPHIQKKNQSVLLDETALEHLEIFNGETPNTGSGKPLTLFNHLNHCKTAMGSRKLRKQLGMISPNLVAIEARLSRVEWFYKHPLILQEFQTNLTGLRDMERECTLVGFGKANAAQLLSLSNNLRIVAKISTLLAEKQEKLGWMNLALLHMAEQHNVFSTLQENNKDLEENIAIPAQEQNNFSTIANCTKHVAKLIDTTFGSSQSQNSSTNAKATNASAIVSAAHISNSTVPKILTTCDETLTLLEKEKNAVLQRIMHFFAKEQPKLPAKARLRYTEAAGYFIEVNKNLSHTVPKHFIRKQTLTREERFTSEQLMLLESEMKTIKLNYDEQEKKIFLLLTTKIAAWQYFINALCNFIANLDVETTFANIALNEKYSRPLMVGNSPLQVKNMRHPIIETQLHKNADSFISNNLTLGKENHVHIITGPNMSGKSTFLRQTALLTVMAHLGSFVAACHAEVPLTSKIFTRVGAKDRLSRGESTFLVEMKETSAILEQADDDALIIMDEIGRGTSTYDGLSIAWGIVHYLAKNTRIKTLFATHFHELTALGENNENADEQRLVNDNLAGVNNFHIAVSDTNGDIIFLKKVLPGTAKKSYGIHVAQMAGMPNTVLEKARERLHTLEQTPLILNEERGNADVVRSSSNKQASLHNTLKETDILKNQKLSAVWEELENIDLEDTTPLQALAYISKLQRLQN